MPASDVPGYILGYRFNQANYADGEFSELSGLGRPMVDVLGTPTFQTVDGHEGILIDNTWHAQFWHPNSWQGTIVVVTRGQRDEIGTFTYKPLVFSSETNDSSNNGKMAFIFQSANKSHRLVSAGGVTIQANVTNEGINAVAMAQDQVTQSALGSLDGVTVNQSTPGTGTVHGQAQAMGSCEQGAYIGPATGSILNSDPITNTIQFFELHFFNGNPLIDAPTEMAAFMAELNAAYAV